MRDLSRAGYSKGVLDTVEIDEGTVFADRYEVLGRLGSGGMATVYRAEDQVLGRTVAVKRMRSEGGDDLVRRFRREARFGATLSHPNVVTVFDTVSGKDGVLIVMEYVDGETLADALERGPLEPDRAIDVLAGVAAALDHAHENGIVHRDVKPANVLLGDDGAVKLADLGIATAAEATRITTTNDIVGTLAYISPERLEDANPGGPESDVYGLAVLAYETLGGELLNRGSTPAEVIHRAATAPPPDLRDVWPEAPPEAAHAIQAGMRRDPDRRPASATELIERLERALEAPPEPRPDPPTAEELAAAPPPSKDAELAPRTEHRKGPRGALVAMIALGLAGVIALVLALTGGDDSSSSGEPSADAGAPEKNAGEAGAKPAPEEAAPAPEPGPEPAPAEESASGAELNDQGYALIQDGSYDEAIPVLQRAVDSYPEGTSDLGYGYALFNLGNALRLAGRPEEAIPILEQRLEIPNQTETVERELELARADAG